MSDIITSSSSSKSEFTALTLWLNREKEAYPHLKKREIVSVENIPTPTMPGHYLSDHSIHSSTERKRKSLGSEMGLYEKMLNEDEGESGFESFEVSGILPLSPDVSLEQEHHSRQIIIVEMEEESEESEELEELEQLEHLHYTKEEEHKREEDERLLSPYTQEEFGHLLDPVEEVTEEPTLIEWEEELSDSLHTPRSERSQRFQISLGQNELHEWARMHGLGTPSSIAPSPAASRFGWAEVIAQTRMQEAEIERKDQRLKSETIFSPFSPAKAMGFKSDYWIMSPTKPTLSRNVLLSRQSDQLFLKEKEADNSNDSGWIDVQPIGEKQVCEYKSEGNSTLRRKTKWAAIIPDRFASLRSRSSRP